VNSVRICVIVAGLVLMALASLICTLKTSASGSFVLTGSMAEARSNHKAVLLPDGKVLVAGGHPQSSNCGTLASAEIYDPATGIWSQTASMNRPRKNFTLTMLGTGKVLAVGGDICGGGVNNTAELYDPSTGTWQYTGNMNFHRSSHAAVLLTGGANTGKVLAIGGDNGFGFAVNTAELYDPITGTWAVTGSLIGARTLLQAVVLNDGRVLVASGQIPNVTGLDTAELYDPDAESWTLTGTLKVIRDGFHRMTVLPNGEVLLTGGNNSSGTLASAERYNPANGVWTLAASMLETRYNHTATMLPNGQVLVAGGVNGSMFLQSAEIYDPATYTWSPAGSLNQPRGDHTATVLQNGQVLLAGGGTQGGALTGGAELYISNNSPQAVCQNVTVSAGPNCAASASIDNGSFDPDGDAITITQDPPGPYPLGNTLVTLTVTDSNGASSQCTATVTVIDDTAPSISCPANIAQSADPGQCSAAINYAVPTASDNCSSATTVCAPSPGSAFAVGTTTVVCTATDSVGNTASCSFTVNVNDTEPPQIACPANIITLNAPALCSAVVNYPLPAATDNCAGVSIACIPPSGSVFPLGTTQVLCSAADASGNSASCGFTVTVENPAPTLSINGPSSGSVFPVDTPVNFTGAFTDNAGDVHTAQWMFDSINQPANVNEATGEVIATYSFTTPGVYLVTLTLSDQCGNSATANTVNNLTALVVIYDPDGGFVTGGGWINSPLGAYAPNPALTGKANFGFVSKYQQGASVPTGETEFQFKVAGLNFHSTIYDWLVVAGARAQYKGSGKINGSGNYGFMLTAIDGQINGGGGVDKFRIKIWDKSNGNALVYDNQLGAADGDNPTTAIGGGSIVIHK
jgi:N-acetylneuraminic acid mutarotase